MPADAEAESLLHETLQEDPELQSSEQRASSSSSGFTARAAGKAALVLTGLGSVALVGVRFTKPSSAPDFEVFARAPTLISLEAAMANDATLAQCTDTPHWANGFFKCQSDGYDGKFCTGRGFSCEAYASKGWCFAGAPVAGKDWALGESLNFPELNCCACGGGSGSIAGSAGKARSAGAASPVIVSSAVPTMPAINLPTIAPIDIPTIAPLDLPTIDPAAPLSTTTVKRPKPKTCAAYSACPKQEGDCCPNYNGVHLSCCDSQLQCFDTPAWANGYIKCADYGYTAEQGCTDGGVTCKGYVNQSFCADGAVVKGKEWTLGGRFNHPELNCCACGKSADGDISNGVF